MACKPGAFDIPGVRPVLGPAWLGRAGADPDQLADRHADVWRQWVWQWDAEPGSHTLQVRAIDATGQAQTEKRQPPFPSGSTGWHSLVMTVS